MIKKRPTFATGHSLAGLPAVSKVLHTDERCELYDLTSVAGSETLLLLVRGPEWHSAGCSAIGRVVGYTAPAASYRQAGAQNRGVSVELDRFRSGIVRPSPGTR